MQKRNVLVYIGHELANALYLVGRPEHGFEPLFEKMYNCRLTSEHLVLRLFARHGLLTKSPKRDTSKESLGLPFK